MFAIAPGFALVQLIFMAISLFVLYWVIRLAVRHALQDQAGREHPRQATDE